MKGKDKKFLFGILGKIFKYIWKRIFGTDENEIIGKK